MPSKPAVIKKAAAPKKKEEPVAAPAPAEPAPVEAAPAEAAPVEAPPAEAAPVEAAPAEAAPAEGAAPAEAEAAPAPPAEEPKAPATPPPPPAEPTSAPRDVFVEDKNDSSVTIMWTEPETLGLSGLDGYTIEVCKDGTDDWKAANEELQGSCRYVIKKLTTGDRVKIRVVAVNVGGRSAPVALPEAVLVKEVGSRPKVHVPRYLRQRYVANIGAKINLTIPFTGKPKPVVTWTKDGKPLDTKRAQTRTTDRDSILFIRTAERDDSGVYELSVKVEDFEDKASIILQIIELPGPPATIKVVDTWGFNVSLEWTPPKDCGNTDIKAYTVQKADKKTGIWFTVGDTFHRCSATVSDLIIGNTYRFRVFAENKCGLSESAIITKEEATILKTGIVYNAPEYKEHNFTEAPKFTALLVNQTTTLGYNTKLYCAVRGSPKPKIEWIKNAMVIAEDPKFRQVCVEGICCLEIRKPVNFDAGMYTCKAKNEHGTDTVSCKLEIKAAVDPNAAK